MQLLRTYHVHKTIWPWASLKIHKGHTKVNVKLIRDFDVDHITINLQHDKPIYCVHRVPDAARHLSTYPPMQQHYPSSLRGLSVKKVSCFQTSRPFFRLFFMCEAQELMRFHQDGGPTLIVMKGHKLWIMYDGADVKIILMRHICRTFCRRLQPATILTGLTAALTRLCELPFMPIPTLWQICHRIWKQWTFHE